MKINRKLIDVLALILAIYLIIDNIKNRKELKRYRNQQTRILSKIENGLNG